MIDAANDRKYGYAGLIPLAVGFAGALFAVSGSVQVFLDYSLLVLVFLTGSCWGALRTKKKKAEDDKQDALLSGHQLERGDDDREPA